MTKRSPSTLVGLSNNFLNRILSSLKHDHDLSATVKIARKGVVEHIAGLAKLGVEATMDSPIYYIYDELRAVFPDAMVVLTTRNPDEWAKRRTKRLGWAEYMCAESAYPEITVHDSNLRYEDGRRATLPPLPHAYALWACVERANIRKAAGRAYYADRVAEKSANVMKRKQEQSAEAAKAAEAQIKAETKELANASIAVTAAKEQLRLAWTAMERADAEKHTFAGTFANLTFAEKHSRTKRRAAKVKEKEDAEKLEAENARLPKVFEAAAVALASAELDSTEKEGRLRDSRELRDSYLRAAEDWAKKVKALRAMQGNSGQRGGADGGVLVRFAQVVREKPFKGMSIISKAYAEYNEYVRRTAPPGRFVEVDLFHDDACKFHAVVEALTGRKVPWSWRGSVVGSQVTPWGLGQKRIEKRTQADILELPPSRPCKAAFPVRGWAYMNSSAEASGIEKNFLRARRKSPRGTDTATRYGALQDKRNYRFYRPHPPRHAPGPRQRVIPRR